MLQTEQLTYRIGNRTLLNSVSFRARAGELLAVVGPNGAGKSTLLRLCAGEMPPASGQVTWATQPLSVYPAAQLAKIRGFLHQQNTLAFPFRVDELVLMGRAPHYGMHPSDTDYAITDEALRMVDMSAFADRLVPTLSGGEQQRVQLARVLAQLWDVNEGLLLLDEPTTGLDLLHQHQLLGIARHMARRGYTVVVVLHDLNIAAQYADRLLMLRSGRVEAFGPPADVLTPALIERVFNVPVQLINNPVTHSPMVVVSQVRSLWFVV